MNNITFIHDNKLYKQITKPVARKLFCEGKTIVISVSNMQPFNSWGLGYCTINKVNFENTQTFEKFINEYIYYNCGQGMGHYLRYYIEC